LWTGWQSEIFLEKRKGSGVPLSPSQANLDGRKAVCKKVGFEEDEEGCSTGTPADVRLRRGSFEGLRSALSEYSDLA